MGYSADLVDMENTLHLRRPAEDLGAKQPAGEADVDLGCSQLKGTSRDSSRGGRARMHAGRGASG
jgi:hypothetical protein